MDDDSNGRGWHANSVGGLQWGRDDGGKGDGGGSGVAMMGGGHWMTTS
jgi:hypothetical protein